MNSIDLDIEANVYLSRDFSDQTGQERGDIDRRRTLLDDSL